MKRLGVIIMMIFLFSCEKQDFAEGNNTLNESTVINGRLYFPTKDDFSKEYNAIKKKTDKEIHENVSRFYTEDFISLRPIVTEENEQKVYEKILIRKEKLINKLSKNSSGYNQYIVTNDEFIDDIDDLEEIIGDEAFASFLNSDRR